VTNENVWQCAVVVVVGVNEASAQNILTRHILIKGFAAR